MPGFLDALHKLAPCGAVSFRGLPTDARNPSGVTIAASIMATSRSPRLASENFSPGFILALLNRTGRDISALSAFPDEGEVVVLPGSAWNVLCRIDVPQCQLPVIVMEELTMSTDVAQPESWGDALADLVSNITSLVTVSLSKQDAAIGTFGKYRGPWHATPYRRPANSHTNQS